MSYYFGDNNLILVTPSDNAWRSKNYNMLIREQRIQTDMIPSEGVELDTSRPISPSSMKSQQTDKSTDDHLGKLDANEVAQSLLSVESLKSGYSSSLLLDTKKLSSKEESFTSYSEQETSSDEGEEEAFVIPPPKLAKALRILYLPSIPTTFTNEGEMILVYQLIYDALRYRVVIDQTLAALSLYEQYPKLQTQQRIIHMLFFDLHQRHFQSRDSFLSSKNETIKNVSSVLFEAGEEECSDFKAFVKEAEDILWNMRIHLAASVARLRIKRHAFCLLGMLPERLRNPSHLDGSAKRPLSFWINNFLIRKDSVESIFQDSGLQLIKKNFSCPRISSVLDLQDMSYFYDRICTNLMFCSPCLRELIVQSPLVKQNFLIIQDRSFCLGPSILCQKLNEAGIKGAIVQTHINSVRITAYLASLLNEQKPSSAVKSDVVLAFGAGNRKPEYEASLKAMGVTNVMVYSETWVQIASTVVQTLVNASVSYATTYPNIPISSEFTYTIPVNMEDIFEKLDNVVAVYTTPPNSYSAVPDPVELAVSRGGDIQLLEDITQTISIKYEFALQDILNSNESKEDQAYLIKVMEQEREREEERERKKMKKLNKEQWEVLSLCLSLPQIQFVLYETHSSKHSENRGTVENAVNAANNAAKTNLKSYQEEQATVNAEEGQPREEQPKITKELINDDQQTDNTEVNKKHIPSTDLFEVDDLPLIKGVSKEDGCYISLIKRKELIHLNNRYLIQMAEVRGLFGKKTSRKTPSPVESAKTGIRKRKGRISSEDSDLSYGGEYSLRPRSKGKLVEIERISAPTVASLRRSSKWSSGRLWQQSLRGEENNSNVKVEHFQYPCRRCSNRGDDHCKTRKIENKSNTQDRKKTKKLRSPRLSSLIYNVDQSLETKGDFEQIKEMHRDEVKHYVNDLEKAVIRSKIEKFFSEEKYLKKNNISNLDIKHGTELDQSNISNLDIKHARENYQSIPLMDHSNIPTFGSFSIPHYGKASKHFDSMNSFAKVIQQKPLIVDDLARSINGKRNKPVLQTEGLKSFNTINENDFTTTEKKNTYDNDKATNSPIKLYQQVFKPFIEIRGNIVSKREILTDYCLQKENNKPKNEKLYKDRNMSYQCENGDKEYFQKSLTNATKTSNRTKGKQQIKQKSMEMNGYRLPYPLKNTVIHFHYPDYIRA